MTKQSGLGDYLLIDSSNISGSINTVNRISGGPAALDMTDITQSAYARQGGRRDGSIEFTAYHDIVAVTGAHAILSTLPTSDRQVTYLRGQGIGSPAASCIGKQINYDPTRGTDGSLTIAVQVMSNGYGIEWGEQVTAGIRTDTTATNGASFDAGASSAFGLQAYCHLLAFTGTNVTIKLQDSSDNVSFSDVTGGAFTAFTAVGSQRIETGRALSVARYLRVATTGTFSSATFLVNCARNQTTVSF